jgi:hypothetical protein
MNATTKQEAREVDDIISHVIREIKAELGRRASINDIEAALLKRQGEIMSGLMEHLANDQDFPPSGGES